MDAESPLWTSHDRTRLHSGCQLTGHAFTKRVKMYARWAGTGSDSPLLWMYASKRHPGIEMFKHRGNVLTIKRIL